MSHVTTALGVWSGTKQELAEFDAEAARTNTTREHVVEAAMRKAEAKPARSNRNQEPAKPEEG